MSDTRNGLDNSPLSRSFDVQNVAIEACVVRALLSWTEPEPEDTVVVRGHLNRYGDGLAAMISPHDRSGSVFAAILIFSGGGCVPRVSTHAAATSVLMMLPLNRTRAFPSVEKWTLKRRIELPMRMIRYRESSTPQLLIVVVRWRSETVSPCRRSSWRFYQSPMGLDSGQKHRNQSCKGRKTHEYRSSHLGELDHRFAIQ